MLGPQLSSHRLHKHAHKQHDQNNKNNKKTHSDHDRSTRKGNRTKSGTELIVIRHTGNGHSGGGEKTHQLEMIVADIKPISVTQSRHNQQSTLNYLEREHGSQLLPKSNLCLDHKRNL